jgi:hypothetical protein
MQSIYCTEDTEKMTSETIQSEHESCVRKGRGRKQGWRFFCAGGVHGERRLLCGAADLAIGNYITLVQRGLPENLD